MVSRRVFLDKDYVRAKNIIACVLGYIHPPDKVFCYPKYIALYKGQSLWTKNGEVYIRITPDYSTSSIVNSINYLRKFHPEYLYYDNFFKTEIAAIPLSDISAHYLPEERLNEILNKNQLDSLETKAVALVKRISKESKVNIRDFGITGSILLKIHNVKISDINLVVYGIKNSWRVHKVLKEMNFERPYEKWAKRMSKVYYVPLKLAEKICLRRVNRGIFCGKNFSLSYVLKPHEIDKKYGKYGYKIIDRVRVEAVILDNTRSLFFPYTYAIRCIKVEKTKSIDIRELICFQGIYCGVFDNEEKVRIEGLLLEIIDGEEKYYSIAVGLREYSGLVEVI